MTPTTLQALRRLLFLSPKQAGEWVGGVTERSWMMWESGAREIPADVESRLMSLVEWRDNALEAARAQISEARSALGEQNEAGPMALVWYEHLDDWLPREPVLWRPHCAVMAALAAEYMADLILFDAGNYHAWRGQRPDTEALRGEWAAENG